MDTIKDSDLRNIILDLKQKEFLKTQNSEIYVRNHKNITFTMVMIQDKLSTNYPIGYRLIFKQRSGPANPDMPLLILSKFKEEKCYENSENFRIKKSAFPAQAVKKFVEFCLENYGYSRSNLISFIKGEKAL